MIDSQTERPFKSFDLNVHMQHWSGCWGGIVPLTPVTDTVKYRKLWISENPWLRDFLKNSQSDQINVGLVDKPLNTKNKQLAGNIFWAEVKFEPNWYLEDTSKRWVITTCVDGKTVYSPDFKYDDLLIGKGLFKGYQLLPGRSHYTLKYWLKKSSDETYDDLRFRSPNGSIVASNLYWIDQSKLSPDLDLAELTPLTSTLLAHKEIYSEK